MMYYGDRTWHVGEKVPHTSINNDPADGEVIQVDCDELMWVQRNCLGVFDRCIENPLVLPVVRTYRGHAALAIAATMKAQYGMRS